MWVGLGGGGVSINDTLCFIGAGGGRGVGGAGRRYHE